MVVPERYAHKAAFSWLENKWVRMIVFSYALFSTTVMYYGWQHYKFFLADWDFMGHLCTPESELTVLGCVEQENTWNTGYTIASSAEFGFSLLAGWMFDNVGPFTTACVGQAIFYVSWVLILMSGSTPALWYVGMLLNGMSVNLSAYPSFILIDIFPNYKMMMAALVLAAQVTSSATMPVLYSVAGSYTPTLEFPTMLTGYLLVFALPSSVLYLLTLPLSHGSLRREYARKGLELPQKSEPDWKVFSKCIATPEVMIFTCWYVSMILQYNYYGSQLSEIAGEEVSNVVGWMFFLQGPFAIIFGYVNDVIKTVPMSAVLTGMQLYSFGLIWIGDFGGYISGVMYVCSNAHVFTTKYCYTAELFPSEHYGKIAGTIALFSGLLQLLNIPISNSGADKDIVMGVYLLLTVPQFAVLGLLAYRQFVQKIEYVHIGEPESSDVRDGGMHLKVEGGARSTDSLDKSTRQMRGSAMAGNESSSYSFDSSDDSAQQSYAKRPSSVVV